MHFLPHLALSVAALFARVNARSVSTRDDPCVAFSDRIFRISAMTTNGIFGPLGEKFQAEIEHNFDPHRQIAGPEISSCTGKTLGKGCKWQRSEDTTLDAYVVVHIPFSAYIAFNGGVVISGEGCIHQILSCTGETSVVPVSAPRKLSVEGTRDVCAVCADDILLLVERRLIPKIPQS